MSKRKVPLVVADSEKFTEALESLKDNVALALASDDKNWSAMSDLFSGETVSDATRAEEIKRSAFSYETFPAYKHAIELDKAFVLGSGVQKPQSNNPIVQYCIDDIWDDSENEETFSGYNAMTRQIDLMQGTGETFYLIYVNESTGKSIIRVAQDSTKIKNIITAPGDRDKILFYEYELTLHKYDFKAHRYVDTNKTIFVPCITASDEDLASALEDGKALKTMDYGYNRKTSTRLYGYLGAYYRGIKGGLRGLPPYRTTYKWVEALKQIVAAAATIAKAKSKIAWKLSLTEGAGKTAMAGIKKSIQALESDLSLANVTPADASTMIENKKKGTYEAVDNKLNQQGYRDTQTMIMQQLASGFDKSEHYFGNPENANLATATSMELPVLKSFENIQNLFAATVTKVLKFAVWKRLDALTPRVALNYAIDRGYDVPSDPNEVKKLLKAALPEHWNLSTIKIYMPEMVGKDLNIFVTAVTNALTNGLIPEKTAAMLVLSALNVTNANDIAAEMFGDLEDGEDADANGGKANATQQQLEYMLAELKKLTPASPQLPAPTGDTDNDNADDNADDKGGNANG
ncbi:MAG TPA: hypothetical protein PKZ78_00610 [Candidatus Goldiibacteriota bacterium]|nr:hypothetical protein [Candidatus Goldiibacteriota bacterium]